MTAPAYAKQGAQKNPIRASLLGRHNGQPGDGPGTGISILGGGKTGDAAEDLSVFSVVSRSER